MMKSYDDDICKDGESVTVPVYLMDATQRAMVAKYGFDADDHRPHFARVSDQERERRGAIRDEYVTGLQAAWRSPAPDRGKQSAAAADCDPMRRRSEAYDQMVKRATEAWRTPHRDWARPDLSSRPEEVGRHQEPDDPSDPANAVKRERELERWQGRDPVDVARDAERRRRAVHAEFCNTLSNAWRGGR